MKNKNKLYAFILSVILVFAMVTSVFAEGSGDGPTDPETPVTGEGTEISVDNATVTKRLEVAEGITLPNLTFEFTATPAQGQTGAPTVTIDDITFTTNDLKGAVLKDGKYVMEKNANIHISGLTTTGYFQYTLAETSGTYDGTSGSVIYSTKTYDLFVSVADGAKAPLYVKSIIVKAGSTKVNTIIFTNTFTKDTSLVIEKMVEGDLADRGKKFEFKITFQKSGTSQTDTFTGMIDEEEVVCQSGVEKTFHLHHGQQLIFNNLPAGTRYKVEEIGAVDGYKASVIVFENGNEHPKRSAAADQDGITTEENEQSNCLIGEGKNKVTFINTHTEPTPTGILMNNLPFLLLVAIGICALGVLAVSKKRRTSKRQ